MPWNNAQDVVSAREALAVTFDTDLNVTRALFVGVGGDVKVRMVSGTDATFKNVSPGVPLPVQVTKVYASGTTASSLLALY